MGLYPFQKQVFELLSAGRSVILQAPTGAGKTRAALYPFLRAWEYGEHFPRKCLYSVPLRVLANQFWSEYEERVKNFGFMQPLDVTIQTGTRAEDPKMEGNLVFTTIDQTLSNFLNIPYALSLSQGNLNAGAVLSSYLIFDELHLFDPETALPTTLHLLQLLRGVVPYLVMTATLSEEMIQALAVALDADPLVLSSEEAASIPSQHKTRRMHTVADELTASAILEKHRQRSVAICNTVERAQTLSADLRRLADPSVEVRLLHSRFLRTDRDRTEAWLQREFGKDEKAYAVESAILVATQVIEVGLDITSQTLHTEMAPAASVIQRAGRCARYQGEEGNVYMYRLPVNDRGQPNYAPYHSGGQKEVCEKTWNALAARSGQAFDFSSELAVVNEAHSQTDQQLLENLKANRFVVADRIAQTIAAQERGAARELIRDMDSRTVVVHPEPGAIENPWAYEGFGIFRGSLFGAFEKLAQMAEELGKGWVMMTADPLPEEEEASRTRTVYCWRHIVDKDDLVGALIVAVNPELASYTAEYGLRLGIPGDGTWSSPRREQERRRHGFAPYRRETFQEHVDRMIRVYEHPFFDRSKGWERLSLTKEMAYAADRLEAKFAWPQGTLDRLARLTIAVHDLGKLDARWQSWAHRWQAEVSRLRDEDMRIADEYLAAHTDYDEQNETEKALNQKMGRERPNHAAEGAAAVMDWLLDQVGNLSLARAVLTAIVSHHNAGAVGKYGEFRGHPLASAVFAGTLALVGLKGVNSKGIAWKVPPGETLTKRLMRPRREQELLVYLVLVRVLRLADGRSQEMVD